MDIFTLHIPRPVAGAISKWISKMDAADYGFQSVISLVSDISYDTETNFRDAFFSMTTWFFL